MPARNPAAPSAAHAPSFGYTDYEGDHNYNRENDTPGRKRANSLSKFFGRRHHHKDEHDDHEVRAKLPLASGASSNAAAPPVSGGQVHASPLESSPTSSESGLFSRAARQRRKSAGSASTRPPLTSSRQRSASVPPASTLVDRTGYDSRAQPFYGLRRRTGSLPRGAGSEDDAATRAAEQAEEPTTTTALLAANAQPDQQPPLFKANFSFRQLQRLERAAHRVEKHDREQVRKGTRGAEIKIAMGVLEILETERKNKKKLRGQGGSRGRGRSRSRSRGGGRGTTDGEGGELLEGFTSGLGGLARQLESDLEHRLGGGAAAARHPPGFSEPPPSTARNGTTTDNHDGHGSRTRAGVRHSASSNHWKAVPTATTATASVPRPLAPSTSKAGIPATPYFSRLTPAQHHLVRHAAAALLLKQHHEHKGVHNALHRAIGGFEKMVKTLEMEMETAWRGARDHAPEAVVELFGTPLKYLTTHEGIDSFHGADPHGTVRIPEFLDHCITAMMQADVTVEGILRKSGKVRVVREIMHALDTSGGNDTVIDLAALDPVTLADLFKQFLGALPDPLMTSHLFKLFIACSHISHVGIRRRCMHLVVCMMPKTNRDVLEVVFLFLEWLSRFAHITIKDGNRMDLTNIATVMAPTLLRPGHRDPKPVEIRPMIAAVLSLLEDQHILHSVPSELAHVLHLEVLRDEHHKHHGGGGGGPAGLQGGAALLHTLTKVL
ncbi:hypothetical protein RHOSPDRAFT_36750 [Rhodotorula sp. JG-1b]|nr:hypothetical protein RHOSPDRAFT_36750 [Rhodotorula sp. JG-1b]